MSRIVLCLAACLAFGQAAAENVDPDGDGSQFAWTENAGWINAEAGGDGGAGLQVSDSALTGWMWTENAGWISLSCENTGNCGAAGYGVKNNGHGALSGLAWGENVGWINFASSAGSVAIDPATGKFGGRAWGENIGWISFSGANYGIKTAWCQSTPSIPTGGPDMRASRVGDDVLLSQLTLGGGAAWHEIVRGSLSALRGSGGDFAAATIDCAGDNVTAGAVVAPGMPLAVPGDGYWYLARRVNCKGNGTYDSGSPGQSGSRDAGIAASGAACP